ncbi:MAG: patatin-like phospholipase family protein [Thermoleophilaceae bacterium]
MGSALVLAGGGARGAYEAGALSVILPELDRRGERPGTYVGTSVGAINAAALASNHHLPAVQQVELLLDTWRVMRKGDIIRPILARTGPLAALRYAGQLAGVPGVRLPSLLDPAPLWKSLPHWIDFEQLDANVRDGTVQAVAAVTTSARSGKTVVFVQAADEREFHRSHAIAYVPAQIEVEHVGASAAIPLIWPPVLIERPQQVRGWYVDGGTRLNAPIKPALDLGAERLVVVAVDSIQGPVMEREDSGDDLPPPDFGDGMLHLLEGSLVDPLIEDMRTLGNVNAFFTDETATGARLYRTMRGKEPYRQVPYIFIGTAERGAIGEVAASVYDRRYSGLRGLRDPDFRLLNELIGGVSKTHGELLSLLFFDEHFVEALIEMGRADASAWLAASHDGDGPWQVGPLGTFIRPRQWTAG